MSPPATETRIDCEPVRVSVAHLTNAEIERMNAADLITLIALANLPPLDVGKRKQLEWMIAGSLRRMAYRTRHACRNWVNAMHEHYQHPSVFRVFEETP